MAINLLPEKTCSPARQAGRGPEKVLETALRSQDLFTCRASRQGSAASFRYAVIDSPVLKANSDTPMNSRLHPIEAAVEHGSACHAVSTLRRRHSQLTAATGLQSAACFCYPMGMTDEKPTRRRFQYSLRTLLAVVTLCALPCTWLGVMR